MKPGDIVRFKSGTPIARQRGETLALVTQVTGIEMDEPRIIYLYLLLPTGEVKVRRAEDVEVVIEAG